ncbi:MAG: hypothetical protein N4A49_05750 [Marinifilaceae bacterium]|jgi:hypothetical protein|nr:hypothetical protein [Marinifilaceae bacterium]
MKRFVLFFIVSVCSFYSYAQKNYDFNIIHSQNQIYSDDKELNIQMFDIERIQEHNMLINPAYIKFKNDIYVNYNNDSLKFNNTIIVNHLFNKETSKYILQKGNREAVNSIIASGLTKFENKGIAYGFASYSNKTNKNIAYNYAINPDLYAPYYVADTMSKLDVENQIYNFELAYSFRIKDVFYGVSLNYKGISSRKIKDPRVADYYSKLNAKIGFAYHYENNLISFSIKPEIDRQTISASSFMQKQYRFFKFYGFGAWTNEINKGSYSYSRLMKNKSVAIDASYYKIKNNNHNWEYAANFAFKYRSVFYEEDSFRNLFSKNQRDIHSNINLKYKAPKNIYCLCLDVHQKKITGTENVYKRIKLSEDQNLYDYVRIASAKQYVNNYSSISVHNKLIHSFNDKNNVHLLFGLKFEKQKEEYRAPYKIISYSKFVQKYGLAWCYSYKKHSLDLNLLYLRFLSLDSKFDINTISENIIIDNVYLPFIINSSESKLMQFRINYIRQFLRKYKIGFRLNYTLNKSTKENYVNKYKYDDNYNKRKLKSLDFSVLYYF